MDFQKALIAEYDSEISRTRKILDAIPADVDFTYKPHPKNNSALWIEGSRLVALRVRQEGKFK